MKHVFRALILATSLSMMLSASTTADTTHSPITTTTSSQSRLWNLQDADILSIINEVSLETGKNFVVDPRVSGKISLISSKPINAKEVYDVFLSILELLGFSAIDNGHVIKIVPNMESTEMATRVANTLQPGHGNEVVVRVIPLQNVSALQVLPVIRPMLPQWSNISSYAPGNVLILVGHAANLSRIAQVIKSLDTASTNGIEVVPLKQASADQIATVLNNLQSAGRASGEGSTVSIAADERTNSILLSGSRAARLHAKLLIAQLDTPSTGASGNTEVVYLRYLQAKTLAPVLGKIAQNILKSGSTDPSLPPVSVINNNGGASKGKNAITPENLTNIQSENNTNALIITAPPTLLKSLKNIVAKLDIRPAQVLVEAVIVEINQDNINNLGIQWAPRAYEKSDSNHQEQGSSAPSPSLGNGMLGIIPSSRIKAVLSLLENKSGVNILSTPSVVVVDNQKAILKVGEDVPFQDGSYATTGNTSTVAPFTTVSSKPVVLQLTVKPQINLGNAVKLMLDIKNDSLQNPDNPGLHPIIKTSQIQNTVIINSGDTLVLGGLISNNITDRTDKIPFLGDLPIVGLLFQHKSRALEKKNLVVFIKPVIVHNKAESDKITNTKYDNIRQRQIDWPVELSKPGEQKFQNILPLWKNAVSLPKPFAEDKI